MILISVALAGIIYARQGLQGIEAARDGDLERLSASMVAILFAATVLTTWIGLAVSIKRFHDRDKSGFWILIIFVPLIGPLWQFIECGFLAGTDGGNRFGQPGDLASSFGFADALDRDSQAYAPATPFRSAEAAPAPSSEGRVGRKTPTGFGRRGR